ncbi:MAG: phage major capsid protein, partial [Caulobacteraceae bacterium]|nr:phage major capsid protein [Caulobacteraceae bacterium]
MTQENKQVAHSPETRAALHEVLATFEAYKASNDQRLSAIETKRADILLEEKLARIDASLTAAQGRFDRASAALRRPSLGDDPRLAEPDERKAAWDGYVKSGAVAASLIDVKGIAQNTEAGSGTVGGYLAPPELEQQILRRLAIASPLRDICQVQTISGSTYRKPVSAKGLTASWVAETASRAETTGLTLDILDFPASELYAAPAATQALLDDALVNMDEWLAAEVEDAFAAQETTAFINGTGTNQPKGLLNHTTVAEASHVWGKIGYLATGVDAAFPASNPTDKLIDLVYTPRVQFRPNGRFMMNRKTVSVVRKFKDSTGNYIWNAALQPGASATLLGYPVAEIETMPDIAANSYSVAFGDFQRGYLIVDRAGIRVLRDPYSSKPNV